MKYDRPWLDVAEMVDGIADYMQPGSSNRDNLREAARIIRRVSRRMARPQDCREVEVRAPQRPIFVSGGLPSLGKRR